ncbi:MAG TPA: hypothetical protein VK851_14460 [Anaerolineales bacterium]|nr:hypothetical protein [Anaerolineales bacterium]
MKIRKDESMQNDLLTFHKQVNLTRFHNQTTGHYESFFLRANHPTRPLAFWIRYTLFSPKDHPENNIGELWATFFNGESNQHIVAKQEYPLADCLFDTTDFNIQIGSAKLSSGFVLGAIESKGNKLAWEMTFDGDFLPLLLLPLKLYQGKFPAAKSLVSLPLAHFNGALSVNDEKINITDWVGSQNHNWGLRHTDLYAWGQVAGFDSHPNSFLEIATAKLKLGPFWTPPITLLVLRHNQKEYALNELVQGIRARGKFGYFTWEFKSKTKDVEIEGEISAPNSAFIGLIYYNPPGGNKHCLNSKIAQCKLHLKDKTTGQVETLETKHRAAFEILTNDLSHGITISA